MAKNMHTIKLEKGSVYQKEQGSNYFFRYQINGQRQAVSLHTKNKEEALVKAQKMIQLVAAPSIDVVAAHVKHARGWTHKLERLELSRVWKVYETHPDRARPKSRKVWNTYKAHLDDFLSWLKENHPDIQYLDEIRDVDEYGQKLDTNVASEYAEHMRTMKMAVDTYCKKISRVGRIFKVLEKYLVAPSPWGSPNLKRSAREESAITAHRIPFPPDKEKEMFEALKPGSPLQIIDKEEIEVLFHILKYTGQRLKDAATLSWNGVEMSRRRLKVKQAKTGKEVSIPIAPALYAMLEEAAKWKVDGNDKVLPKTASRYATHVEDGANSGSAMVTKQVQGVLRYVGLEPSVDVEGRDRKLTVYGMHSFRHGFASHCAETGVPRAVCASILGTDANIIDAYYVHIGEEAKEKAIMAFSSGYISAEEKNKNALAFIAGLKVKSEELVKVERLLKGMPEKTS